MVFVKTGAFFLKLLFRVVVGICCILIINGILMMSGVSLALGINLYSIAMLVILGIPSLIIAYGIILI